MSSKRTDSFKRKIWIIFSLMSFIPFLTTLYIFESKGIEITQEIYVLGAMVSVGGLLAFFMVVHFAEDLSALSEKTSEAAKSREKVPIQATLDSMAEVDALAQNFNLIIGELQESRNHSKRINTRLLVYANEMRKYQEKLRKEAVIRTNLSRYVGGGVLEHLIKSDETIPIKNVRREVTVLFADIRSFTTLAEAMGPEEVIEMLNEYFSVMVDIIFKYNGVLDKFVGDELMAVFGMIGPTGNPPLDAVNAALEMRRAQKELMRTRERQGKKTFKIGTGINTGEAVIGSLGAKDRLDFTVIGDMVNIGARFEQIAEGQEIIVGERTYQLCKNDINMTKKGEVQLRNRNAQVPCYIIVDES